MDLRTHQTGFLLFICLSIASRLPDVSSMKLKDRCLKSSDCSDSGAVCRDSETKAILSDALGSPLTQSFDPSTADDYIEKGLDDPFEDLELSDSTAAMTTPQGTNESRLVIGDNLIFKDVLCTIIKVLEPQNKNKVLKITTPTSVVVLDTTAPTTIDKDKFELNDAVDSVELNDIASGLLDDAQEPLCKGKKVLTDKVECKVSGTVNKQKQLPACTASPNSTPVTKSPGQGSVSSTTNSPVPESTSTAQSSISGKVGKVGTCQCDKKLRFPCSNDNQCKQRFPRPNMRCYPSDGCPSRIANGYCRQENKEVNDAPELAEDAGSAEPVLDHAPDAVPPSD